MQTWGKLISLFVFWNVKRFLYFKSLLGLISDIPGEVVECNTELARGKHFLCCMLSQTS